MGSNALPAIPLLVDCTTSTNRDLAWRAMRALGRLQLEPDRVVPALITQLNYPDYNRIAAVWALRRYGSNAMSAVPFLLQRISDPDEGVRMAVTNALMKIAPEVLTNAPAARHQ
jgi:HEAT repeat protein